MQRGAKCLKTKRITLTGRLKLFKKGLAEKITQKIIDKSQTARIHGSWVSSKMSLGAAVTWWNISLFPKMPVFQLLLLFCTLVVYRWWHHQIGDCFLLRFVLKNYIFISCYQQMKVATAASPVAAGLLEIADRGGALSYSWRGVSDVNEVISICPAPGPVWTVSVCEVRG